MRARAALLGCCLAAAAALAPPQAVGAVHITAKPGLKPSFSRGAPDYVSRCVPGEPLRISVSASDRDTVAVGSRPKQSGDFTVEVSRETGAAVALRVTSNGRQSTHHVRCLPQDFPSWTVHRHRKPESQWYVITPIGPLAKGYVAIFDARGVPVWWMYSGWYGPWDGKLLANGNLIWGREFNDRFGVDPREGWEEHRLDGSTVRVLRTQRSPADIHDVQLMPNGNYLLETYTPRSNVDLSGHDGPKHANVYDGEIQELRPDGSEVWSWNSRDHIKLDETTWWSHIMAGQRKAPPAERTYDLVHINSVEPDGDGFVVSARFIDAVFRIDRKTKAITWKLGGTHTSKSLAVKKDPLGSDPLSGQHDARLYADRTLTVFDNATLASRRPRVVRYRIDPAARTARLLEAFGEASEPLSGWGGSTRKLPGGNWVTYWGGTTLMTEQTASGKPVLDLRFLNDKHSYRAFPIPRGRVSARQLRQGMNLAARASVPPSR